MQSLTTRKLDVIFKQFPALTSLSFNFMFATPFWSYKVLYFLNSGLCLPVLSFFLPFFFSLYFYLIPLCCNRFIPELIFLSMHHTVQRSLVSSLFSYFLILVSTFPSSPQPLVFPLPWHICSPLGSIEHKYNGHVLSFMLYIPPPFIAAWEAPPTPLPPHPLTELVMPRSLALPSEIRQSGSASLLGDTAFLPAEPLMNPLCTIRVAQCRRMVIKGTEAWDRIFVFTVGLGFRVFKFYQKTPVYAKKATHTS